MAWLGTKLGGYLAAVGGVLLLLLGAFLKGRKSKANEVQAATAKTIIKTVKKDKVIEKANRDIGADGRRDRLRKYASNSKGLPLDKRNKPDQ